MKKNNGCVYFFKHVGLSPIKIGYSLDDNPCKRFDQFRTYAPYGAELIGFVNCEDPKKLETELHEAYKTKRLSGEWFEIEEGEITLFATFYPDHEDLMNNKEYIEQWILKNKKEKNDINSTFDSVSFYEPKRDDFEILNTKEIADKLGVDKTVVLSFLRKNNFKIGSFRLGKIVKRGYKVWTL